MLVHVDVRRAAEEGGLEFYLTPQDIIVSPGNDSGAIPREDACLLAIFGTVASRVHTAKHEELTVAATSLLMVQ